MIKKVLIAEKNFLSEKRVWKKENALSRAKCTGSISRGNK
jgi:hypothetical protein